MMLSRYEVLKSCGGLFSVLLLNYVALWGLVCPWVRNSNHPPQHKYAAIRYLHNRLNTYLLQHDEYKEELDTIHDIMLNNGFPLHTHIPPTPRQPTITPSQKPCKTAHKWAPFTYFGKETTFITNIFKKANIRVTLRTNNTLQKLLMPKPQTRDK